MKSRVNNKVVIIVGIVAVIVVVLLFYRNHQGADGYQKISSDEALEMINSNKDVIVIDVRRKEEYQSGHISGAINIPNESIDTKIKELPDYNQTILVYCQSGNRSRQASNKLIKLGYQNVIDFGGIIDWNGQIVK